MAEDSDVSNYQLGTESATHMNGSEHTLEICWCLQRVSSLPKYLASRAHSLSNNCSVLWKVEAHFEKARHNEKDGLILTIKLHRIDIRESVVRGTVEIILSDQHHVNLHSGVYSTAFPASNISNPLVLSVTLWNPGLWSVDNGNVGLNINIKSEDCCSTSNRITATPNLQHRLVKDMQTALDNRLLADVVFSSEKGPLIHANKFVLQMRSPCFNHLRSNETITIQNMTGKYEEAFRYFISYLYTGIVGDTSVDIVCKLYVIALQYQANDLKGSCGLLIISKIATENVCEILKLAHEHKDTYMKEAAMRFISVYYSELVFLPSWKQMVVADSLLHAEVTHYCAMQRTLKI